MSFRHSPTFVKCRAVAFSIITFISFGELILQSVLLTLRWDTLEKSEQSLLALFIVANVMTVFMLPILLLREFRTWLDGARLLLLVGSHIAVATTFTVWFSSFQCLVISDSTSEQGTCMLLNLVIMIAGWVPILLLLAYSCCLAVYAYRIRRAPRPETFIGSLPIFTKDEEAALNARPTGTPITCRLPMMEGSPYNSGLSTPVTFTWSSPHPHRSSHQSNLPSDHRPSLSLAIPPPQPHLLSPGYSSTYGRPPRSARPGSLQSIPTPTSAKTPRRQTLPSPFGSVSYGGSESNASPTQYTQSSSNPGSRRPSLPTMLSVVSEESEVLSQYGKGTEVNDGAPGGGAGRERIVYNKHESVKLARSRLPPWYY